MFLPGQKKKKKGPATQSWFAGVRRSRHLVATMGLTGFNSAAAGREVTPSTVEPAVNISVSPRKTLVDKSTRYGTSAGLQSDSEVASSPA